MPTTPGSSALNRAIAELYEAFPDRRDGGPIDGCAHCIDPEDARVLGSSERTAIPERVLSRYAFKAVTTWGTGDDLRSLVPPVVEALARGWIPVAPQVSFDRIARAGLASWTARERDALGRVLVGWMERATRGERFDMVDIVESAVIAGLPVEPLLSLWEATDDIDAVIELAYCVEAGGLKSSYAKQPSAEVEAWLGSERARAVIERALAAHPDHEYAYLWRDALAAHERR